MEANEGDFICILMVNKVQKVLKMIDLKEIPRK